MTGLSPEEEGIDALAVPSPMAEFHASSTEKMMYWESVEGGANKN
jgi:hypothetical protein